MRLVAHGRGRDVGEGAHRPLRFSVCSCAQRLLVHKAKQNFLETVKHSYRLIARTRFTAADRAPWRHGQSLWAPPGRLTVAWALGVSNEPLPSSCSWWMRAALGAFEFLRGREEAGGRGAKLLRRPWVLCPPPPPLRVGCR